MTCGSTVHIPCASMARDVKSDERLIRLRVEDETDRL